MKNLIECEICGKSNWKLIETYKYKKIQKKAKKSIFLIKTIKYLKLIKRILIAQPRLSIVTSNNWNKYQLSRLEVLFNVWFENSEEVIIKSQYCVNCGFALFTPRPSKMDVEAKYNYLIKNSFDYKIECSDKKPQITLLDTL